jgi:predicted Ser/Thr protein kinase
VTGSHAPRSIPGPGEVLGDYVLERELGRGGMGAVFLGRHRQLGTAHAIKVQLLRGAGPTERERFAREARALARIDRHSGVVQVHSYDVRPDGLAYFVLELVEGGDLRATVETAPLDVARLLTLGEGIAGALAHVHRAGIVHRDLKPANVLLRGPDVPVLTDFGIARDEAEESLTRTQQLLGTPEYMAPEQIAGARGVSNRADVFSLGGILYRLATGQPAFSSAEGTPALLAAILSVSPDPPRSHRPELPRDLERLILACLDKEPSLRPSADEVANALRALRDGERVNLRNTNTLARLLLRARRRPALALIPLVALVLAGGAAFFASGGVTRGELSSALRELPLVLDSDPLLAEEEERTRATRLARRLAAITRRLAGESANGDDLEWLTGGREVPESDRANVRRLVARLALAEGRAWVGQPRPDPGSAAGEEALLCALDELGWRRAHSRGPSSRALARELLERARGAPSPIGPRSEALLSVLAVLDEGLEREALAARRAAEAEFSGRRAATPPTNDPRLQRHVRRALGVRGDPLLRYRTRRRVEHLQRVYGKAVEVASAWAAAQPQRRWGEPAPFQALGRLLGRVSGALGETDPRVAKLLTQAVQFARAASAGGRGLEALVRLLRRYAGFADWESPEFRRNLHDLLLIAMTENSASGRTTSLESLLILPRLRRLPISAGMARQLRILHKERRFDAHFAKPANRRGDDYLVKARCLDVLVSIAKDDAALTQAMIEAYGAALGERLGPQLREFYGLSELVVLSEPLSTWWVTYARARIARAVIRSRPVRARASALALGEVWELTAPAARELDSTAFLDFATWASSLLCTASEERSQRSAGEPLAVQALNVAQRGLVRAWGVFEGIANGSGRRPSGELTMDEYSSVQVSEEHLRKELRRLLSAQAVALDVLGRASEGVTSGEEALKRYKRLVRRPPVSLRHHLAHAALRAERYDLAAREARAILAYVERNPGYHHAHDVSLSDDAKGVLAWVAFRQSGPARARELLAARPANPRQPSGLWAPLQLTLDGKPTALPHIVSTGWR